MRKWLFWIILPGFIVAALYQFVPPVRHWIYYQYFVLFKADVVGGPCGINCNGVDEFPQGPLPSTDTLPDFFTDSLHRIHISGKVFDFSGKPAPGIMLYLFQANSDGIYPKRETDTGAALVNGYLRTWLTTGPGGEYAIYTTRPGNYPGTTRMAHIHCIVKEPGINEYVLPDFIFPNDPHLTPQAKQKPQEQNGGLVIPAGTTSEGIPHYKRDLYLGRGVVNYTKSRKGK